MEYCLRGSPTIQLNFIDYSLDVVKTVHLTKKEFAVGLGSQNDLQFPGFAWLPNQDEHRNVFVIEKIGNERLLLGCEQADKYDFCVNVNGLNRTPRLRRQRIFLAHGDVVTVSFREFNLGPYFCEVARVFPSFPVTNEGNRLLALPPSVLIRILEFLDEEFVVRTLPLVCTQFLSLIKGTNFRIRGTSLEFPTDVKGQEILSFVSDELPVRSLRMEPLVGADPEGIVLFLLKFGSHLLELTVGSPFFPWDDAAVLDSVLKTLRASLRLEKLIFSGLRSWDLNSQIPLPFVKEVLFDFHHDPEFNPMPGELFSAMYPNATSLSFSPARAITWGGLTDEFMENIEELRIRFRYDRAGKSAICGTTAFGKMQKLKKVTLIDETELCVKEPTSPIVTYLRALASNPQLHEIRIRGRPGEVPIEALENFISETSADLRVIVVENIRGFPESLLIQIAEKFPNLRKLSIMNLVKEDAFADDAVDTLLEKCSGLKHLVLENTNVVGKGAWVAKAEKRTLAGILKCVIVKPGIQGGCPVSFFERQWKENYTAYFPV